MSAHSGNDAKPATGVLTSYQSPTLNPQSPGVAESDAMEGLFHQIALWLAMFTDETEQLAENTASGVTGQPRWLWLQPKARQAEAAMHQLRDLRLVQTPAGTELSQSLTVLVLAADMLVQGQLCGGDEQESYALLRRNADRALKSLSELRVQSIPGDQ